MSIAGKQGRGARLLSTLLYCCSLRQAFSKPEEHVYMYIAHITQVMIKSSRSFLCCYIDSTQTEVLSGTTQVFQPAKPASRDLPRNVRKERLSTKAGKQPKPRSFPASASGAQSVLADNPLVPVSLGRMEVLGRSGVWEPGRVWVDLTPTLGVMV